MAGDEPWADHLRHVGEFIRRQRQLAELSQRDLARLVNLSDTYMSQLERGLHEPSIRVLRALAQGLGIGAEQLIAFAAGLDGGKDGDRPPGTEEAIRADSRLSDAQKKALLGVLRSYLQSNA
jgi:transcriptional regulator with XRE-family HTH domain